jgi:plasmid stabilization system protein ParE
LADFPKIGRTVPEAAGREDVRELIFQGYRIIYLTQPKRVFIVTIIHGSRDLAANDHGASRATPDDEMPSRP